MGIAPVIAAYLLLCPSACWYFSSVSPLVFAGIVWLGGLRFLVRTAYAVVVDALLLDLLRPYLTQSVTTDLLPHNLDAGRMGGAGVGLVFRMQGTTGGDDIVAELLHRLRLHPGE